MQWLRWKTLICRPGLRKQHREKQFAVKRVRVDDNEDLDELEEASVTAEQVRMTLVGRARDGD